MRKTTRCLQVLALLAFALGAGLPATAIEVIRDDFTEDPDFRDGEPLTWHIWPTAVVGAAQQGQGIAIRATGSFGGLGTTEVFAGDVCFRAQVRGQDFFYFATHVNHSGHNSGYVVGVYPSGSIELARWEGSPTRTVMGRVDFDPTAGDVLLELRSVGPTVEFRIWPEGDTRPQTPLLILELRNDETFPEGGEVGFEATNNTALLVRGAEVRVGVDCDEEFEPFFRDCNGNGEDDLKEIEDGDAEDANGNGKPDDCDLPLAHFTLAPQAGEVPLEVEVNAERSEPALPGHPIVSYAWDFGDGAPTARGMTAKHMYTSPGRFEISLTIEDDRGVRASTTKRVNVLCPSGDIRPWDSVDVGAAAYPGSARFEGEEDGADLLLCAGGNLIAGTSDDFYFIYRQVSGDFRLTAEVSEFTARTGNSVVGLMCRESLNADARFAATLMEARETSLTGRFRFRLRTQTARPVGTRSGRSVDEPIGWLRIERRGSVFTGWSSFDGKDWTFIDDGEIPGLPETIFAGVAAAGRDRGAETFEPLQARVTHVEISALLSTSFRRGDCNDDGEVDISDAVCTLEWLFLGREEPGCVAATNTNGDEAVDISDPVSLLGFLFLGGPAPVGPFPACGPSDLEADVALGCEETSCP